MNRYFKYPWSWRRQNIDLVALILFIFHFINIKPFIHFSLIYKTRYLYNLHTNTVAKCNKYVVHLIVFTMTLVFGDSRVGFNDAENNLKKSRNIFQNQIFDRFYRIYEWFFLDTTIGTLIASFVCFYVNGLMYTCINKLDEQMQYIIKYNIVYLRRQQCLNRVVFFLSFILFFLLAHLTMFSGPFSTVS